jgi:hypothetical protein
MTPQCGICTAYRAMPAAGPGKGLCCLLPPVPICAGLMQPTQGLAGIRSGGPQPLMLNARPQVAETEWCAQFHPTPEAEEAAHAARDAAIEAAVGAFREPRDAPRPTAEELATGIGMRETAFVPGEGLVTREVPFRDMLAGPSEPWSGARDAVEPPCDHGGLDPKHCGVCNP